MMNVKMTEVQSRLGSFCIIKINQAVLISPCDTRMKILEALANGAMTSEEITEEIGVSYSCVMDHMDLLERLGVVETTLRRDGGRRRIYFGLSESPLRGIEELFATAAKTKRAARAAVSHSATL
jgi:DNA-binding transcriptional ArsR family regulator